MNEFLEILSQFGGGRDDPSNLPVRFLLPALFWFLLAFIAFRQWKRYRESKDLYVGIAALAGITRELLMFIAEYGGWKGYVSFDALYLFFPPFEHAVSLLSGVLAGYAFLRYFLEWKRFPDIFLIGGLSSIALLYTATAPLWVMFLGKHPDALFGSFWGDMAFRVCASLLMGSVLVSFAAGTKKKKKIPATLYMAFAFLFLDEFLMVFNLATHEVARTAFAPIRHNLHIWAIPFLLGVYWTELNSMVRRNEQRLAKMNSCFLNFSDDADNNIRRLTLLCKELLDGDFVLYDSFRDDTLNSPVHCQIPYDLSAENRNWKDRFSAAVLDSVNNIMVITKLHTTKYAVTDPNVGRYNLQSCMGKAVTDGVTVLGSLCVAYRREFSPDDMDRKIMGIIASAIQVEEKRNQAKVKTKSSENQLRALSSYLQSVREKERSAFAREVHDELGQMLTALKMDLHWIAKRFRTDQEPMSEKTRTMIGMTDSAIQTVQKIASELRPSILDDLGLQAAMEWQSRAFENRTDIHTEAIFDLHDTGVSREVSTALFRIYQEALTNIVRHACATEVRVSLRSSAGKITMDIQDNGRGIHEQQVSDPNSFGLIGIRERVYSLGGDVTIHGSEMRGTGVTVTIPLTVKETAYD